MSRGLLMIAAASAAVAAAAFGGAYAIGGRQALQQGGVTIARGEGVRWTWMNERVRHHRNRGTVDGSGPQQTREIAWPGYEIMALDVPADVTFVQAPGPGHVRFTGPSGTVQQVILHNGLIHFRDHVRNGGRLQIVVTAPRIVRFELSGSNRLTLQNYNQERLQVDATGDAQVDGKGSSGVVDLYVSGSAQVNLAGLAVDGADVEMGGDGRAEIAPARWANLYVGGSSQVMLAREPEQLDTDIQDKGQVLRLGQAGTNRSATPLLQ